MLSPKAPVAESKSRFPIPIALGPLLTYLIISSPNIYTHMEKENILKNVNRIPANTLFEYIQEGIVSFEDLQATGKFVAGKQGEVRELMRLAGEANRAEDDAWATAQAGNNVASYQNYLTQYPEGRFVSAAHAGIQATQGAEMAAKQAAIDDLLRDRMAVNELKLRYVLGLDQDNNQVRPAILTPDDLANHGVIPLHALKLVLNPPPINDNIYGWGDIPPLSNESTDVYVLGVVGSGKSCMLAGLLAYTNKTGRAKLEVTNTKGFKYAKDLITSARIGYAPMSTSVEGVNYISMDLYSQEEEVHPVNIIEMSGEFLNQTYEDGSVYGDRIVSASNFLTNDNQKIIFLVVDYYKAVGQDAYSYREDQEGKLELTLGLLEAGGILEKTDGLYLILSKSDLLPNGAMDMAGMEAFVDANYRSLRSNIKRLKDRYGFDSKMFPFSLGEFYQSDTFRYEAETSKPIVEQLIRSTFKEKPKKRGWF